MGTIKLNLKARELEPKTLSSFYRRKKKEEKAIANHIGIKTARKLATMLKNSGLCPVITRHSFSQVTVTY